MNIDFTEKELEVLQNLAYNELNRQRYLAMVNETKISEEFITLLEKLKGDE